MYQDYLKRALKLAEKRRGFCSPNPAVGAVVVKDGKIIGEGWHEKAGAPHAEVMALASAGSSAAGGILYVTLEPCSHTGRTPPCTDLIIKTGIKAVYYGFKDSNLTVSGQGEFYLKSAGIACEQIELPEINAFYRSYAHWLKTKKPWVTAKIALSLDEKIASVDGKPL